MKCEHNIHFVFQLLMFSKLRLSTNLSVSLPKFHIINHPVCGLQAYVAWLNWKEHFSAVAKNMCPVPTGDT